ARTKKFRDGLAEATPAVVDQIATGFDFYLQKRENKGADNDMRLAGDLLRWFLALPSALRSAVSCNAMISCTAQDGMTDQAMDLFHKTREAGYRVYDHAWISVFRAAGASRDINLVRNLQQMLASVTPSPSVWTVLLSALLRCKQYREVIKTVNALPRS